ncbi:hypothetical protein [Nocardia nova]|uniref:hypothetical protein n=1 Tax=Nocardia nova TaxID=37330 RepID=UPI0033D92B9A
MIGLFNDTGRAESRSAERTAVEQAWRRAVPLLRGAAFLGSTAEEWQEAEI